jgi:post-segregation antitoxin (ccd killing protein)
MAQRINISIPEELYAELEKWRDQLNVSGICQEALRKEVARQEAVATAGDDLDAVVERLRAEKDEWEKHWYEVGVQLGYEWAKRAGYRRLVEWLQRAAPPTDALMETFSLVAGVWLARDRAEKLSHDYPSMGHFFEEGGPSKDRVVVREYNAARLGAGWLKGVKDFWDQVKDAL